MSQFNPNAIERLRKLLYFGVHEFYVKINEVLGTNFCDETLKSQLTEGTVHPLHLITISNHWHFSMTYFSKNHEDESKRDYHLIPTEKWVKVDLRTYNLVNYVHKGSRNKAIDKLQCKPYTYDGLRTNLDEKHPLPRLKYRELLNYIDKARMYEGDVIWDNNMFFEMKEYVIPFYNHTAMDQYYNLFPSLPKFPQKVAEPITIKMNTQVFLEAMVIGGEIFEDRSTIITDGRTMKYIANMIREIKGYPILP